MQKKYIVRLTDEDRVQLTKLLTKGNVAVKKHKIAQILLGVDASPKGLQCTDSQMSKEVKVSAATVNRLRKKFYEGGLEEVFRKKFIPRISRRKFDGEGEARLIALCCSQAPEGHSRWTLRLLANKIVECQIIETVSHETIRHTLKKMNLNLG
jgi:transposase